MSKHHGRLARVPAPQITRQLVLDINSICKSAQLTTDYDREAMRRLSHWQLYAATWIERQERGEQERNNGK